MLTSQTIDPNQEGNRKPFILLRPLIAVWHWLVPPTQAHRDRQSTTARWVAIGSLITISLSLMVAMFFYAKPLQDKYQNWQAENLYEEARMLANDGKIPDAFIRLQKAVKIAPENINAIRMNAEFLTLARRPEALHYLDQLERHGKTKDTDKYLRVRALMNLQRPKEASDMLEEILTKDKPSDALMKLAEDVWGKSQKDEMLTKALKGYAEKHPEDRLHQMRLAKVQLSIPRQTEIAEGIRRAWSISEGKDDLSLQALELLDSQENLPIDDARRLIEALRTHPKSNGWHLVAALRRQMKLEPLRKNALIEEAVEKARGRKGEQLVPLVRWLIEPPQNEYLKVLALVTEEEAKGYQPLLTNYLTALTMLKRYNDLERLVTDPKVNSILSLSLASFFRAHLAYVLNKTAEETRAALIKAKDAADIEHQPQLLEKIALYAEERGHNDIAEDAYRSVALSPQSERIGYQGLIRTTKENGNTEGLLAASGEAVRRWPDDSNYLEHFLYANLLAGRELELTLTEVQKLLKAQPKDAQRRLFVALAFWRMGDVGNAIGYLVDMDVASLSNGQRAVLAAIARDCDVENAKEAATLALREVDPKARMLPEERICFAKAAR